MRMPLWDGRIGSPRRCRSVGSSWTSIRTASSPSGRWPDGRSTSALRCPDRLGERSRGGAVVTGPPPGRRYRRGMSPARGTPADRPLSGWAPTPRTVLGAGALGGVGGLLAACASPAPPSACSATSGPTGTGGVPATPFALDATTTPKLDALFDQVMTATGIAGMPERCGWATSCGSGRAGTRTSSRKLPTTRRTNVRIASVTTSFVATAVLQLVDARAVKLDDVLENFVPGIANGPTITMRNLLGMTSGNYDVTSNAAFNATFDADPDMPWSFADTLAIIKANAPLFAPGTNIAYCDSNYSILGEILQMVTGKPARAVIADSIAARLGPTHTLWPADSAIPAPHPAMSRKDSTPRSRTRRSTTQRIRRRSSTPSTRRSRPARGRSSRPSTTSRSGAGRSPRAACCSPRPRRSGSRPGGSTGPRSTSATAWAASGSTTSPGTTVRSTGSARWSSVIRRGTSPSPSSATSRPAPRRPPRRSATSSSGSSTRPSGPEPHAGRVIRHLG